MGLQVPEADDEAIVLHVGVSRVHGVLHAVFRRVSLSLFSSHPAFSPSARDILFVPEIECPPSGLGFILCIGCSIKKEIVFRKG